MRMCTSIKEWTRLEFEHADNFGARFIAAQPLRNFFMRVLFCKRVATSLCNTLIVIIDTGNSDAADTFILE
jgi:hypothetical protein